jgi:hypothetical protein
MASVQVPVNAVVPLPKKIPMFDRAELEVVTISKSAVKLNCVPEMHSFGCPATPPWNTLTLPCLTAATFTSPAVQLRVL